MSTSFEIYPGARMGATFGEIIARAETRLRDYFSQYGIHKPIHVKALIHYEKQEGFYRDPRPSDPFVWSIEEESVVFMLDGVKGNFWSYLGPIWDDSRAKVVLAREAGEDQNEGDEADSPQLTIRVLDSTTGEFTEKLEYLSQASKDEVSEEANAEELARQREEDLDCWYNIHCLKEMAGYRPDFDARIESAKKLNFCWHFHRSGSQPPIVFLAFAVIAGIVAELTEGLINSDDVATGNNVLPATGEDFLTWYFRADRAKAEHNPDAAWDEWCGHAPYGTYVTSSEKQTGLALHKMALATGQSYEGPGDSPACPIGDSAVHSTMAENDLVPRD